MLAPGTGMVPHCFDGFAHRKFGWRPPASREILPGMSFDLVVLAAGMGSRFGGLKQVEPVGPGGELIIEYSAYDALKAGSNRVVFVIRRDIEQAFRAAIGRRIEARMDVAYAFQETTDLPEPHPPAPGRTKPWGTARRCSPRHRCCGGHLL